MNRYRIHIEGHRFGQDFTVTADDPAFAVEKVLRVLPDSAGPGSPCRLALTKVDVSLDFSKVIP